MRFSQVFLPIFPVPKRRIFLVVMSFTDFRMYWTEAKDTEVAPEESFVSVLMRLLA